MKCFFERKLNCSVRIVKVPSLGGYIGYWRNATMGAMIHAFKIRSDNRARLLPQVFLTLRGKTILDLIDEKEARVTAKIRSPLGYEHFPFVS